MAKIENFARKHVVGIKDRDVPGVDAAGESSDQRRSEPGNHAHFHDINARHRGGDGILAHGLQRQAKAGVLEVSDSGKRQRQHDQCGSIGIGRIEGAGQRHAIGPLGDAFERRVGDEMEHGKRRGKIGNREIGARKSEQRSEQQAKRDADDTRNEHRRDSGRLQMHYHDRKAVSARAEETDISKGQITGETVDDVDALGEDQEDDEIEQQQVVLIDSGQHRKQHDQRQQNEKRVLERARQHAPAFRAGRSDARAGSGSAAHMARDRPRN